MVQRGITEAELGGGLNDIYQLQSKIQVDVKDVELEFVDEKCMSKERKNGDEELSEDSRNKCRICWGSDEYLDDHEDEDDDTFFKGEKKQAKFNPLISPCNCTGSVGMIHVHCLKDWLETKKTMKVHKGQVIIKFKKLECELCKALFPF